MMAKWVCVDCGWSCMGDRHDAHAHHHEDEESYWDHWIFEFRQGPGLAGLPGPYNVPSGRSIHTSDYGGFYSDKWKPGQVAEQFMLKMVNRAGPLENEKIKNSRQASELRGRGGRRG